MGRLSIVILLAGAMLAGFLVSKTVNKTSAPTLSLSGGSRLPQAGAVELSEDVGVAQGDFVLPDLDGIQRRLSDWDGKVRIVNFWATWCVPCRREIPLLKSLQDIHANEGFQVLGVAIDQLDAVREYADDIGFNYPILMGSEDGMEVAETFGIDFLALPLTFIVAPDGELLFAHVGEFKQHHIDKALPTLRQLLAGTISAESAREALTNAD